MAIRERPSRKSEKHEPFGEPKAAMSEKLVPPTGASLNSGGKEDLSDSFASTKQFPSIEPLSADNLYDVLDVLAEWDDHLTKVGVDFDDLEPRP